MVARGDIFWADFGPLAGRRSVCVITRDAAIEVRSAVTSAPISPKLRDTRSMSRTERTCRGGA